MIFGRTELIIGPSKEKNDQESFAEVHLSVSHQNPDQNCKNKLPSPENPRKTNVRQRNIKCWGSSKTRFDKV